jgi:DNA-binding SARP family transcriptional activator
VSAPPTVPRLQLQLLGAPELVGADGQSHPLKPIDALLLARLALDGPQQRRSLARWLWPDTPEERAATHLRQRLFRLKGLAGAPLVQGDGVIGLVATLQVDLAAPALPAGVLLGAWSFEDEAVADWLATQRLALRTRQQEALATAAEAHAARGELATALELAARLVALAPDNEHAHRRLMKLHFRRGDLAAAESAYAHCRDWMQQHLGLAPGAETRELIQTIRRLAAAGDDSPRRAALPVVLMRPPRRVGRHAEWAALQQGLTQGRPVLLVGEAGAGKTRLVEDTLAGRRGWVRVGARPGDASLAQALLARLLGALAEQLGPPEPAWVLQALAHLVPAWPAQPGEPPTPLRQRQALEAALRHWVAQGLAGLCVEDLHHGDSASVATLAALASATSPEPASPAAPGWLLSTRPRPAIEQALADSLRVALVPLEPAVVEELVASLGLAQLDAPAWAPMLTRRSGGSPLFVLQLLCTAHEQGLLGERPPAAELGLPAGLLATVTERFVRLAPEARALLRLLACAGADFSLPLAARVLGKAPVELADAWRELEDAGVMAQGAFVHDLLHEAALAWTPQDVARVLHAQIAAGLEAQGAAAPRRALHWRAAQAWAPAALAHAAAAAEARQRGAAGEEIDHWQQAAEAFAQAGDAAGRFDALCQALRLQIASSQVGEDTAARCAELLHSAADDGQRANALELRAYLNAERYEPEAALEAAQQALALLPGAAADEAQALSAQARLRLLATQRAAQALARLSRPGEALALMEPLQPAANRLPDRDRLNWALVRCLALEYADRRSDAVALSTQAADDAERLGLINLAAEARGQQAVSLILLGRLAQSIAAAEQSLALSRQAGLPAESLLVDTGTLATNLRDLGHFDRYFELATGLPERLRASGNHTWACNAEHDLAVAYAWLGRPELALPLLDLGAPELPPLMHVVRLSTRARLASDFGVPAGGRSAAALAEAALAGLGELGVGGSSYFRLGLQVLAARHQGGDEAAARAAAIAAEALERENLALALLARSTCVRIHLAAGQAAAAADAARHLLALVAQAGHPVSLYPPELGWLAWQALRTSAPEQAQAALARARAWIEHTAREHVPEAFRRSFLQRNPVNVAVLAAAG